MRRRVSQLFAIALALIFSGETTSLAGSVSPTHGNAGVAQPTFPDSSARSTTARARVATASPATRNPLVSFLEQFCPDRLTQAKRMVMADSPLAPRRAALSDAPSFSFSKEKEQAAMDRRDEALMLARGLQSSDHFRAGFLAHSCLATMLPGAATRARGVIQSLGQTRNIDPGTQQALSLLAWGVEQIGHLPAKPVVTGELDGTYKAGFAKFGSKTE